MKPIEDRIENAAGDRQLAEGSAPTDNKTAAAIGERPSRMELQARALRLSTALGMRVGVDATGWLNEQIAIFYRLRRRRTIRAYFVRVGHIAPDAAVSGEHGVRARCRRYNAALEQLHQLADQLETRVRSGRVTLVPNSALADAYQELSGLDERIASRQATHMGSGVVYLDRLGDEIALFDGWIARLAPIVEEAELAASARPPRATPEPSRRWLRWPHWISSSDRDGAS